MSSLILTTDTLDPQRVGGKAANLALLVRAGQPVPPWFVVSTAAFEQAVDLNTSLGDLESTDRKGIQQASGRLREAVLCAPLPDAVAQAVRDAYQSHFQPGEYVAVRSSGVGEDSAGASFAGQFDSLLHVADAEGVLAALKTCWASAFSERILTYRLARGLADQPVSIAVIIQRMVDAERSGVLFTAHPTTGSTQEMVISAVWGLGEGLVSGRLAADSYVVSRVGGEIVEQEIAEKRQRVVQQAGGGTQFEDLPEPLRERAVLDPTLCARLAEMGAQVEAACDGAPQDIEWSLANGTLQVLQTRPITTLDRAAAGKLQIWDNSNIIESYSGVTTPLTFSFARNAYREVYRQFLLLLGVPQQAIDADDRTLAHMLGLIRGRIYYNLNNWYRLVSYLPGFELNRQFMEQMMGVRESATLVGADLAYDTQAVGFRAKLRAYGRLLRVGTKLCWHFYRLDRSAPEFMRHFESVYAPRGHKDLSGLDCDALATLFVEVENQLLRRWQAPIVNDFSAMIFFGLLRLLSGRWIGAAKPTLSNELLCGEGDIDSTEPTMHLLQMAQLVRANPQLQELFEKTPAQQLHEALQARQQEYPELWSSVVRYLELYGDRCMMELKLESLNLRDDPSFIYSMITNYAAQNLQADALHEREQSLRDAAEATVRARLRWRPMRRWLFGIVLRRARASVRNRENMRFARTKIFGLARRIFRALGQHYAEQGLLDAPEDVFYLEVPEIFGALDGSLTGDELGRLARLRRERFETYRAEPAPPDRFATRGLVYLSAFEELGVPEQDDPDRLKGIGVCPGVVTGPCRVITSPEDEMVLGGEILVAQHTDPGWVPLFLSASGLLVERGSLLSHSAIVARELGLPAIIAIPRVTERIADRQTVTMNGETGMVNLS